MRLLQLFLFVLVFVTLTVSHQDSFAAKGGHKTQKSSRKAKKQASAIDVWDRVRLGLRIPTLNSTYHGIESLELAMSAPRKKLVAGVNAEKESPNDNATELVGDSPKLTTVISPKQLYKQESQLLEKYKNRQQHVIMPQGNNLYKKDLTVNKYTELGKKRLGKIVSQPTPDIKNNEFTGVGAQANNLQTKISKSPFIERVRTRLNFHPELSKRIVKSIVPGSQNTVAGDLTGLSQTEPQIAGRCADLATKDVLNMAQNGMLPENYRLLIEQCKLKRSLIHERVNRQIAGFSQRISFVNDSSERARPYLYHIVDSLSKYNLPYDLALLPIVESGYRPTALSPASAAGIWQFIPATGKSFGLEQNDDFDGRLDITAATHAAIRFLSGLRDHYRGDWLLALAAYNCGPGTVDAAIARNLEAGLDTDYWSLNLPAETQDYVPRLLALGHIFSNPGGYGLKLRFLKNEPYFIKVDIEHPFDIDKLVNKDLATIAKLADFSDAEFGFLNTAYIKSIITKRQPFSLLMPITNANQLHQSLAFMAKSNNQGSLPNVDDFLKPEADQSNSLQPLWPKIQHPLLAIAIDDETQQQSVRKFGEEISQSENKQLSSDSLPMNYTFVHFLDKGETLASVANSYGMTEAKLKELNKFKRRQKAVLGQRLIVPIKQVADTSQHNYKSILFKENQNNKS